MLWLTAQRTDTLRANLRIIIRHAGPSLHRRFLHSRNVARYNPSFSRKLKRARKRRAKGRPHNLQWEDVRRSANLMQLFARTGWGCWYYSAYSPTRLCCLCATSMERSICVYFAGGREIARIFPRRFPPPLVCYAELRSFDFPLRERERRTEGIPSLSSPIYAESEADVGRAHPSRILTVSSFEDNSREPLRELPIS